MQLICKFGRGGDGVNMGGALTNICVLGDKAALGLFSSNLCLSKVKALGR